MQNFSSFFKKIGLDEKEANVYEYLLNNGEQSVAEISKGTGLKRGDLYNILYSFRDSGIVNQTSQGGKAKFAVNDPYTLRNQIAKQRNSIEEAEVVAEAMIPKLISQYNLTYNKPSVRYFEGINGIVEVHKEVLKSGTKNLLLLRSIFDGSTPELSAQTTEVVKNQIKAGIKCRLIAPLEAESQRRYEKTDRIRGIERRIVESDQLLLPSQIMIWEDCVAVISLRDKIVATIIENKDSAETFRAMFEYIWLKSEGYHNQVTTGWVQDSE